MKKQSIIKTIFIIVLVLTISIYLYLIVRDNADSRDDIFGPPTIIDYMFLSIMGMLPPIVAEYDIYFNIKYFMSDKSEKTLLKNLFNRIFCVFSVAILLAQPYFIMHMGATVEWIWLICYFVFRRIYAYLVKKDKQTE